MNRIIFFLIIAFSLLVGVNSTKAQSYNQERTALTNFLIRMYENSPFDGVKAIEDYENTYLISVVKLDGSKYKNESVFNRVASTKAMSQASRFFNGSNISEDLMIRVSEKEDGTTDTEIIENIRENSAGYVKQLEHLTSFPTKDGERVFIYITPLNINIR